MIGQFHRLWCARCRFAGKEAFMLGTVEADSPLEALRALEKLVEGISPVRPMSIDPIPGVVVFSGEGDD